MKKVALTGNIGSGKSWVSQLFQRIGIPVFNSDEEAKRLYDRDDIREAMKARFGEDVYFDDDSVNRKRVAEIIFNDAEAMHEVEQLLYPALNAYFDEWAEEQEAPYVLYESAIIFEKHLEDRFDAVILVSATEQTRLRRVMLRDHCEEDEVRERMASQWTENEKREKADFIIEHDNDDEDEALLGQVLAVHEELLPSRKFHFFSKK
jgi:dephospho-CoA kinase